MREAALKKLFSALAGADNGTGEVEIKERNLGRMKAFFVDYRFLPLLGAKMKRPGKPGLRVERQRAVPIIYEEIKFQEGFRADLEVENQIIVELKSVEQLAPVHGKQLLTYLRLLDYRLGLLINFGAPYIKNGIVRIANKL